MRYLNTESNHCMSGLFFIAGLVFFFVSASVFFYYIPTHWDFDGFNIRDIFYIAFSGFFLFAAIIVWAIGMAMTLLKDKVRLDRERAIHAYNISRYNERTSTRERWNG